MLFLATFASKSHLSLILTSYLTVLIGSDLIRTPILASRHALGNGWFGRWTLQRLLMIMTPSYVPQPIHRAGCG